MPDPKKFSDHPPAARAVAVIVLVVLTALAVGAVAIAAGMLWHGIKAVWS